MDFHHSVYDGDLSILDLEDNNLAWMGVERRNAKRSAPTRMGFAWLFKKRMSPR